jgi:hypothetical protein
LDQLKNGDRHYRLAWLPATLPILQYQPISHALIFVYLNLHLR